MVTNTQEKTGKISIFQTYEVPEFIKEESESFVYRISDDEAAKVTKLPDYHIGREMLLARMLHHAGISVPEPRAWDKIQLYSDPSEIADAYIMEFIPGKTGKILRHEDSQRYLLADELAKKERERAMEMGFTPGDANNSGNYILTPDNKIVVIDFTNWAYPTVPKIQRTMEGGRMRLHNLVDPNTVFDIDVEEMFR